MTTPVEPGHRNDVIETVIVARLSRNYGDSESFQSRLQLLTLVETTASRLADREQQGRFALHRLRAMKVVLDGIPVVVDLGRE
ncbi:MAG TPA: hypothetical protein VLV86_04360, partial [Vicinamibacterales bacterium]|nr:hypothetical protein [Vicinamibacterales bacterium]